MTTAAIVLAGGSGTRMRQSDSKVFATVGGRPLLAWSTATFLDSPAIDRVVVVIRDGDAERARTVLAADGIDVAALTFPPGGATRPDSERAGLGALAGLAPADAVLIHDAARPFVTVDLIARVADATVRVGGAVPVLPLGAGVHRLTAAGRLEPQPDDLARVQTPQGFRLGPLRKAYRRAARDGFVGVDTCEVVQRYASVDVAAVEGDRDNLKVTFAGDLARADTIAARRRSAVTPPA